MWSILGGGALDAGHARRPSANDTARDDRPPPGRTGLRRPDHRRPPSSPSSPTSGWASTPTWGPPPRWWRSTAVGSGLPPVFLHNQRVSWVELETGAELHVRMLLARRPTCAPRACSSGCQPGDAAPGACTPRWWPPTRWATRGRPPPTSARPTGGPAGCGAGPRPPSCSPALVDLLDAITPPLRGRLHVVIEFLPLAGQRGRRGPDRHGRPGPASPWAGASSAANAGPGGWRWCSWPAPSSSTSWPGPTSRSRWWPWPSWCSWSSTGGTSRPPRTGRRCARPSWHWGSGRSASRSSTTASIELFTQIGHHRHSRIPWWTALWAVSERLVGIQHHRAPAPRRPVPLHPTLLAIGLVPGGADPVPPDPPGGRPAPDLRTGRRAPGPGHRAPARHLDARLLRPAQRQAVVLPPRQPGGLRRLRRGLPHLARSHRPAQRAGAGVGRVPALRRQPRLGHRR